MSKSIEGVGMRTVLLRAWFIGALCVPLVLVVFAVLSLASAYAAARVTPGVSHMETAEAVDRECDRLDAKSDVAGAVEYDCLSARSLRRTCRTYVVPQTRERRGNCRWVIRYGVYAPGGIRSSDQLWRDEPCWKLGHGLNGWAFYRMSGVSRVFSGRRSIDAFLGPAKCKVIRTGMEARVR